MPAAVGRAAAVVLSVMMLGAAPAPRPAPLRAVEAAKVDPRWQANICALPGLTCGSRKGLALYRAQGQAADIYWLIVPERPAIAKLRRTPGGWSSAGAWDFAGYGRVPGGGEKDGPLRIHPALYPVAADVWAVALTHARAESYSGGGGAFESADFVPLRRGPPTALHRDVPFSCSKMVRACFGEGEHETSPHCHDETEGWMSLQMEAPPEGAYRWSATWRERLWPSGKPASAKRLTSAPMGLGGDGPAARFCDPVN